MYRKSAAVEFLGQGLNIQRRFVTCRPEIDNLLFIMLGWPDRLHLQPLADGTDYVLPGRPLRLQRQQELAEADCVQPRAHHIQRSRFSATKSTFFPSASAAAMVLTIVCDFPVPGGPSTATFFPLATSTSVLN